MQETQAPPTAAPGEANAQLFDQQSPGPLHFSQGAPGLAFAQTPAAGALPAGVVAVDLAGPGVGAEEGVHRLAVGRRR